ncbi:SIMPL domain-containing protein [Euzebya sp.]|uniref:SIMPL domain-containing protein n=1 Tax=Euzebya sp. TaxID=1971409 RepID=UPI003513D046
MAEIIVRGRAEARLDPTEASLTITVQARAAGSQSEAVALCARRAAEVDEAVDARRGGVVRRALTSSVRTGPEWDHTPRQGRQLRGYVATRTTDLACAPDGEALTALAGDLAAMVDVQVAGPRWSVAADAEGWDRIRAAAAVDARRRAGAYAEGLGLAVGRVVWLSEPGLRGDDGPQRRGATFQAEAMMSRSAMADGGDEEPLVVRIVPEPVAVVVELEAAFDLG